MKHFLSILQQFISLLLHISCSSTKIWYHFCCCCWKSFSDLKHFLFCFYILDPESTKLWFCEINLYYIRILSGYTFMAPSMDKIGEHFSSTLDWLTDTLHTNKQQFTYNIHYTEWKKKQRYKRRIDRNKRSKIKKRWTEEDPTLYNVCLGIKLVWLRYTPHSSLQCMPLIVSIGNTLSQLISDIVDTIDFSFWEEILRGLYSRFQVVTI